MYSVFRKFEDEDKDSVLTGYYFAVADSLEVGCTSLPKSKMRRRRSTGDLPLAVEGSKTDLLPSISEQHEAVQEGEKIHEMLE